MLQGDFLSHTARYYAFSRWLAARQRMSVSGRATHLAIPFIPPMALFQNMADQPFPIEFSDTDQSVGDFLPDAEVEAFSDTGLNGFTNDFVDFVVLDEPPGAPFSPFDFPSPPLAHPIPATTAPVAYPVDAPAPVVASPAAQGNAADRPSAMQSRATAGDGEADLTSDQRLIERDEQPDAIRSAPSEAQRTPAMPPTGQSSAVSPQNDRGSVGHSEDRADGTMQYREYRESASPDTFTRASATERALEPELEEAHAESRISPALARPDESDENVRLAQSQETALWREARPMDDRDMAIQTPIVRSDSRTSAPTRTEAIPTMPGVPRQNSALAASPAADTRWQRARRFIEKRLTGRQIGPRADAKVASTRKELGTGASGVASEPAALPQPLIAAPFETSADRPVSSIPNALNAPHVSDHNTPTFPETVAESVSKSGIAVTQTTRSDTIRRAATNDDRAITGRQSSGAPPIPVLAEQQSSSVNTGVESADSETLSLRPDETPSAASPPNARISSPSVNETPGKQRALSAPPVRRGESRVPLPATAAAVGLPVALDATNQVIPDEETMHRHAATGSDETATVPQRRSPDTEVVATNRAVGVTDTPTPQQPALPSDDQRTDVQLQRSEAKWSQPPASEPAETARVASQPETSPSASPTMPSAASLNDTSGFTARQSVVTQPQPIEDVGSPLAQLAQPASPPELLPDAESSTSQGNAEQQQRPSVVGEPQEPRPDPAPTELPAEMHPTQPVDRPENTLTEGLPNPPRQLKPIAIQPSPQPPPVRPRVVAALPRAAHTIVAWVKPRQARERTQSMGAEPIAVQSPIMAQSSADSQRIAPSIDEAQTTDPTTNAQPNAPISRSPAESAATEPQRTFDLATDSQATPRSDSAALPFFPPEIPTASTTEQEARVTLPLQEIETSQPPTAPSPFDPGAPQTATARYEPPVSASERAQTGNVEPRAERGSEETVSVSQPRETESAAVVPSPMEQKAPEQESQPQPFMQTEPDARDVRGIRQEDQVGRPANQPPTNDPMSGDPPQTERGERTDPIMVGQPSVQNQPQPTLADAVLPTTATPVEMEHPVVAVPRPTESVAGEIASVRSDPSSERTAPEPPVVQSPRTTVPMPGQPVVASPDVAQRTETFRIADRAEREPGPGTPDDTAQPSLDQSIGVPSVTPPSALVTPIQQVAVSHEEATDSRTVQEQSATPPDIIADTAERQPRQETRSVTETPATRDTERAQPSAALNETARPESSAARGIGPEGAHADAAAVPMPDNSSSPRPMSGAMSPTAAVRSDNAPPLSVQSTIAPPETALPLTPAEMHVPSIPGTSSQALPDEPRLGTSIPPRPMAVAASEMVQSERSEPDGAQIADVPMQQRRITAPPSATEPTTIPASEGNWDQQTPSDIIPALRPEQSSDLSPSVPPTIRDQPSVTPEPLVPHTQGIEQTHAPERASQSVTDRIAPAPSMIEPAALRPDTARPQPNEMVDRPAPIPMTTTEPADQAQRTFTQTPIDHDEQPIATVAQVIVDDTASAQAPHLQTVIAHDVGIEAPTESIANPPSPPLPQDAVPSVATQPQPSESTSDESPEQPSYVVNEVRQARRRPLVPMRPPVEDTQPAPPSPESEARENEARAQALERLARLRRLYYGETAAATVPTQPGDQPAAAQTAPETLLTSPVTAPEAVTPPLPVVTTVAPIERGNVPTPITLPDTARRFLQPLVGFDPRSVPIYRDTPSDRLTTGQNADALTDGSAVVVASSNIAMERPETLGILAHELTHVARRQHPRFVPPIARNTGQTSRNRAVVSEQENERTASLTEESLAERVEERVIRSARGAPLSSPRLSHPLPQTASMEGQRRESPSNASPSHVVRPDANWGDLPAPWETVPDWMQQRSSSPTAPGGEQPEQAAHADSRTPVIQRAGHERSLADQREHDPPRHDPHDDAPKPDLDVLARQVYAILKDRLAVERRRTG